MRRVRSSRAATACCRNGVSMLDVLLAFAVLGLLVSIGWPMIGAAREKARQVNCQNHLRQLGTALLAYSDSHRTLPPAAVWSTDELRTLALHRSRRVDLFTHANWAQMLLPFAGEESTAARFDPAKPVGDPTSEAARTHRLELMVCPSDRFNDERNPYLISPVEGTEIAFARGNYAINGGSQCFEPGPGDTAFRTGDATHLVMEPAGRTFQMWGNGIAGFNRSFSINEFTNGTATLVAFEEVRAGIHPLDPRGVWSLGQIGGSVTWAHGVNGDAYGPNNQHPRSDDILGCRDLHERLGAETLQELEMPCVVYGGFNVQATSRSSHPGGVNILMLDNAVRFASDEIDPGLWHVMHSHETPTHMLEGGIEAAAQQLKSEERPVESPPGSQKRATESSPAIAGVASETFRNSLGMEFVVLPAGDFVMGLPDINNSHDLPPESPPHPVTITAPFALAKHEVTRAEFETVMGSSSAGSDSPDDPQFPAGSVSWYEAAEFCRKLSELPKERRAGRSYRLPTEAEWEYAARCGSKHPHVWKSRRAAGDESGEAAGIEPPLPLAPVGSYPPNAWGLYDMRGNVWEWCADWFDRDYYSRSPSRDPQGPRNGFIKVVRGSDWTFIGEGCKISYAMMPPWQSSPFVGFRVICERTPAAVELAGQGPQ